MTLGVNPDGRALLVAVSHGSTLLAVRRAGAGQRWSRVERVGPIDSLAEDVQGGQDAAGNATIAWRDADRILTSSGAPPSPGSTPATRRRQAARRPGR